ncbi:hypothetical protein M426DRAFT_8749 [Hypoxylon sp. CI-4A]|nr:hypothetical protein M426DRAFT_8749 [Hypoxylon sp. CI-4A]
MVCDKCFDYFAKEFGKKAVDVSEKFLEYKERAGLPRQVVDPRLIPADEYLTPEELESFRRTRTTASQKQPFPPRSPMRTTQPQTPPPPPPPPPPKRQPQYPPPVVHRERVEENRRVRTDVQGHTKKPIPRKPVPHPNTPKLRSSRSRPRAEELNSSRAQMYNDRVVHTIPENQVIEHGSNAPIDLSDLVDNEREHHIDNGQEISHGRALTSTPIQPIPLRRPPKESVRPRHERSDSSLIKRLHKAAETVAIAGYPQPEYRKSVDSIKSPRPANVSKPAIVPKLTKAPKVPAWRVDTPEPVAEGKPAQRDAEARSQSAMPLSRRRDSSSLQGPPTATFFRASPSSDSLNSTLKRASSQEILSIPPPPRTAGVQNFRERGVPSVEYMEKERRESQDDLEQYQPGHNSMLVSMSTPSPSYSCAVQSCFCGEYEAEDKICPSCRARRRLEKDLKAGWI